MRIFILSLIIISLVVVPCFALQMDSFSISFSLYPQKMPDSINNGWYFNNQEWASISINIVVKIWKGLYIKQKTKTFIFGTRFIQHAPSSVKFRTKIGYDFNQFNISYSHYCRHYFKQFDGDYSDQDKLVLEYYF